MTLISRGLWVATDSEDFRRPRTFAALPADPGPVSTEEDGQNGTAEGRVMVVGVEVPGPPRCPRGVPVERPQDPNQVTTFVVGQP